MSRTRVLAAWAIALLATPAELAQAQLQQPRAGALLPNQSVEAKAALSPRLFSTVRLGPVGRTTVRAGSRQLAGAPSPAPGLGARLDLPVHENWLVGFDLGVLFEADHQLKPYGNDPNGGPWLGGLIADLAVALRRVWPLDHDRIELYLSAGVGVSGRPAITGDLPLTDAQGSTQLDHIGDGPGFGVLAQAGVGSTFWLSRDFGVFVELLAIARQTNAVMPAQGRGDYLLQVNDTHALLCFGVGTTIGAM